MPARSYPVPVHDAELAAAAGPVEQWACRACGRRVTLTYAGESMGWYKTVTVTGSASAVHLAAGSLKLEMVPTVAEWKWMGHYRISILEK